MDVALIEYFPNHGYEVWITDVIKIGEGMGDVFDRHDEAIMYAKVHDVPIVDLSGKERKLMDDKELVDYLSTYLIITPNDEVAAVR